MTNCLSPGYQHRETEDKSNNTKLIDQANANVNFLKAELYRIVQNRDNLIIELFDKVPHEFNLH